MISRIGHLGGLAAAMIMGSGMAAAPMASHGPAQTEKAIAPAPTARATVKKKRLLRTPGGGFYKPVRSRGKPPKRKLKANRNHISKRVKRKHRRAA